MIIGSSILTVNFSANQFTLISPSNFEVNQVLVSVIFFRIYWEHKKLLIFLYLQGVRIRSLTRYGLIGVIWFICVSFKLLWQRYSIQLLDVAMGYPHWLAYSEGSSQKHWKSILNSIFLTLSCWFCKSKLMPSSHQSSVYFNCKGLFRIYVLETLLTPPKECIIVI